MYYRCPECGGHVSSYDDVDYITYTCNICGWSEQVRKGHGFMRWLRHLHLLRA